MTRPDEHERPVIPGIPVADMAGGLFATMSIVSALLSRELGDGTGEHLDIAITDGLLSFAQVTTIEAMGSGGEPTTRADGPLGSLPLLQYLRNGG